MSTKLDTNQFQTDVTLGIGSKSDVPIVGATDRPLVNLGLRQATSDPSNLSQGRTWFRTDLDSPSIAANTGILRMGGIVAAKSSDDTVANTTTDTALGVSYTFPANSLTLGKIIRFDYWGQYQAGSGGTLKFDIHFGNVVITFGNATATAGLKPFFMRGFFAVKAIGAAGTAFLTGQPTKLQENAQVFGQVGDVTNFDTTIDQLFTLNVKFSIAGTTNAITHHASYIEVVN